MTLHDEEIPEVIELPIDGCLDLHAFAPKDCKTLIPDYLALCAERGIFEVRIVHGKGHGILQRSVHAILARLPIVADFRLADGNNGGWGATMVTLHRRTSPAD